MQKLTILKKEVLGLNQSTTPIDPGIMDTLIGLKAFKIPTQSSCFGHSDKPGSFPYVDIHADNTHIDFEDYSDRMQIMKKQWIGRNIRIQQKLLPLLEEFYRSRKTRLPYMLSAHTIIDWSGVRLKSVGADLLLLLKNKTNFQRDLKRYQKEMTAFGKFLIKKAKVK